MRDSNLFGAVIAEALTTGTVVRFSAEGTSMYPTIRDGEVITIAAVAPDEVVRGDVLLCRHDKRVLAHRVVRRDHARRRAHLPSSRGRQSRLRRTRRRGRCRRQSHLRLSQWPRGAVVRPRRAAAARGTEICVGREGFHRDNSCGRLFAVPPWFRRRVRFPGMIPILVRIDR